MIEFSGDVLSPLSLCIVIHIEGGKLYEKVISI